MHSKHLNLQKKLRRQPFLWFSINWQLFSDCLSVTAVDKEEVWLNHLRRIFYFLFLSMDERWQCLRVHVKQSWQRKYYLVWQNRLSVTMIKEIYKYNSTGKLTITWPFFFCSSSIRFDFNMTLSLAKAIVISYTW